RAVVDGLDRDAAEVRCDHDLFAVWVARSRRDLHLLLTETPQGVIPYAGIPWYVAPFGRDCLITALQVLPFEPRIAAGTLRVLARMLRAADLHDGYLTDTRRSPRGLVNQGWKDSQDAVMHASGHLAETPIALAEVQGYQYAALQAAAGLAAVLGLGERAPAL